MIAFSNRLTRFGMAATCLAGLAGCTSIEEAAKIDPRTLPPATQPADQATGAPAQRIPTIIDGTLVAYVPVPTQSPAGGPTIENALASTAAAAVVADASTANPGAPTIENALASAPVAPPAQAAMATATAESTVPGVQQAAAIPAPSVSNTIVVPQSKPATTLAYAATPTAASLATLDNQFDTTAPEVIQPSATTGARGPLNDLISKYAEFYEVPEALVHRVVHRESRYNPAAFNRGHYGLMQIKYATAKSMGFDGPAKGLFDAENNLKYAIKYLRGAYLVADRNLDGAVRLYARGYYYDAKRKGMLHVLK